MRIIEVTWRDCTHFDDSQLCIDDIMRQTLIIMQDIGYLIAEDREKIAIASEYIAEHNTYRHISWIPKCNVIKRRTIKR